MFRYFIKLTLSNIPKNLDDQIIKYNINSYKYSATYILKTKIKISKDINWKNVVLGRKEKMGSPNAWDFST